MAKTAETTTGSRLGDIVDYPDQYGRLKVAIVTATANSTYSKQHVPGPSPAR